MRHFMPHFFVLRTDLFVIIVLVWEFMFCRKE